MLHKTRLFVSAVFVGLGAALAMTYTTSGNQTHLVIGLLCFSFNTINAVHAWIKL